MHDPDGYVAANIIGGIVGGATVGGAVLGASLGPYVVKLAKSIGSTVKTAVKTLAKGELCFVTGTQILTENGHIPIEDIKAGDYVYAENPETGEKGLKRVEQTFINEIDELISRKRVRYIAVNDGIDTNRDDNDIAPFKNILNDMYA